MERSLAKYIWKHTRSHQFWILAVVAFSMVPYFLSLNLPKQIVNGPIQGTGFETATATEPFMHLTITLPFIGQITLFEGIQLERVGMLIALSGVFLLLVIVNGLFKFYINTYKGRLGERLLRRVRFELVDMVLRFPPDHFKRIKNAEIASMIKDEIEPLGDFTGDAFVQPAMLGGQALTALVFIFSQSVSLGVFTTILVSTQLIIIPKMRKRQLILGRQRELSARELSGRVGEIIDSIGSVHAYDTSNYERADIVNRLGHIFKIRYELYQWKFLVKFINNFLASLTPFFFYSIGGYLALTGHLDIGQLVAVIAAYDNLPGPLKDLIDWDQARQNVQVKYAQVFDQFYSEELIDPAVQAVSVPPPAPLKSPLVAQNVTLVDDSGTSRLDGANLQIQVGDLCAIIGGGGDALAEVLGRATWPSGGRVMVGGQNLQLLPEAVTGRRMTYIGPDGGFFSGSLGDNLLYSLKHAPQQPAVYDDPSEVRRRKWEQTEAHNSGNPDFDLNDSWIDLANAGVSSEDELVAMILEVMDCVQLSPDILEFALNSKVDPNTHPKLAEKIVEIRRAYRAALVQHGLEDLIIPFEPKAYNDAATISENLLFGMITGQALLGTMIGSNPYFRDLLASTGLAEALFDLGVEMLKTTVELFGDLPEDHPFFQQLSFMTADELPAYEQLLQQLGKRRFKEATDEERMRIIGRLAFAYIEPRYRFGLLSDELKERIVAARAAFHSGLPGDLQTAIEKFDPDHHTVAATLRDNLLFGRLSENRTDVIERLQNILRGVLIDMDIFGEVLRLGVDFNIGTGGRRLTQLQRQKLNLARGLIRQSEYYIVNRPLAGADPRLQERIVKDIIALTRRKNPVPAVVWTLTNSALASYFDRVIIVENGRLSVDGERPAPEPRVYSVDTPVNS